MELGQFVTNPSASVSGIRRALLDSDTVKAITPSVSASTLEWLHLLSVEHGAARIARPDCASFRLKAPDGVNVLHVRQLKPKGSLFLCSTDAKYKFAVHATEKMPFDKFADDSRFVFSRENDVWVLQCRDPRV